MKATYEVFNAGTRFLRTFCSSPIAYAVFILSLSSFLLWKTFLNNDQCLAEYPNSGAQYPVASFDPVPWDALEGINQITLDTHLAPKADLIWNRCLEDCPVNQHCFLKILAFETAHKLVFLINFNVRSLCFHRVSDWGLRQFWSIQQYSVKRNTGGPPSVTIEEKPPRQFQSIGRCELY